MRRALPFLVLLLAGLCACAPADDPRAPFTESRIPPGLEQRFYPPEGWAWGLLKVGKAPAVRYGVAAPATTPRGQVIILPAEGEVAEAWFETARDLTARGFVVWVLEPAGQGGSGRYGLPRNLIHAPSLDPDVAALMVLGVQVARNRPRFVVAAGAAAPIAARAAELGLALDGLVLIDLRLPSAEAYSDVEWRRRLGLGGLPAPAGMEVRDGLFYSAAPPTGDAFARVLLTRRWQRANPDLRMGGASGGWYRALAHESGAARASWSRIPSRVLMLGRLSRSSETLCAQLHSCSPGRGDVLVAPGHAPESPHQAFMRQLLGFIDPDAPALAPAPAAVTLDSQS